MKRDGTIVWVSDAPERRDAVRRAIKGCRPELDVASVTSGAELLRYLLREDEYAAAERAGAPKLVFIDAALPDGEALAAVRRVKENPLLRRLPIIVYAEAGWSFGYDPYAAGANAFMTLPTDFDNVCGVLSTSLDFWLDTARLPAETFASAPRGEAAPNASWFDYRIHDDHRLGVAELSGRITGPDLLHSIETFLGDPKLHAEYRILADYTGASEVDIGMGEAKDIGLALFRYRQRLQSGQTAVVVSDRMHLLISELLIAMGALDRSRIRVFTSMNDAVQWLQIPEAFSRIEKASR